jgi:cytidylate kinase
MHIVAIDGPAGSGKSSVSKASALKLGFGYLDTGAAYRALTWAVLENKINIGDLSAAEIAQAFDYAISLDPSNYWVKAFGIDVTEAIREPKVALRVSEVAGQPEVRLYMKELTRTLVAASALPGVVVEGRDITTVIFPDAQTRILLTASEEVRLSRRSAELPAGVSLTEMVTRRDQTDSKVVDFMLPAEGVTLLDSTELSFDATVDAVIHLVRDLS